MLTERKDSDFYWYESVIYKTWFQDQPSLELVKNAHSQVLPRPTPSETLGLQPQQSVFEKSSQ